MLKTTARSEKTPCQQPNWLINWRSRKAKYKINTISDNLGLLFAVSNRLGQVGYIFFGTRALLFNTLLTVKRVDHSRMLSPFRPNHAFWHIVVGCQIWEMRYERPKKGDSMDRHARCFAGWLNTLLAESATRTGHIWNDNIRSLVGLTSLYLLLRNLTHITYQAYKYVGCILW